jgi:hypothetical protein
MDINEEETREFNEFITTIFDSIIVSQITGNLSINNMVSHAEQNLADLINYTMNDNSNDELCKKSHFKLNCKDTYTKDNSTECSVCTDKILKEEQVYKCVNCNNVLHYICMNDWIQYNEICPLCRFNIKDNITDTFLEWIDSHLEI